MSEIEGSLVGQDFMVEITISWVLTAAILAGLIIHAWHRHRAASKAAARRGDHD